MPQAWDEQVQGLLMKWRPSVYLWLAGASLAGGLVVFWLMI